MEIKKYFVIGNPVSHSLSPKLHNHWLKRNNINAIYKKIKLEENEIKNFIQDIKNQKIIGCNVTVPFKKTVIPFLDRLSQEAEHTQSVNTIIFDKGNLVGHNTDIAGFEKAIKNLDFIMKGKKILILGAGGVVSSLIFALMKMDVLNITVSNRTLQRAEILKNLFKTVNVVEWGKLPEFDVIINATSLGLNRKDNINLNFDNINKEKLFYDVIYNPKETNFLRTGKSLGCKVSNGKMMFIYQAFEAFKLWHKVQPEINEDLKNFLDS